MRIPESVWFRNPTSFSTKARSILILQTNVLPLFCRQEWERFRIPVLSLKYGCKKNRFASVCVKAPSLFNPKAFLKLQTQEQNLPWILSGNHLKTLSLDMVKIGIGFLKWFLRFGSKAE